MHLIVGPPASGKTTKLLEVAHTHLRQRKRVWWVGLPMQKAYVYRRATEQRAVLGLEVLTSQQLYYRLLAANFGLKPILTGPGRVALVGEALHSGEGPPPGPGEARLFTRAIAEAKRNGVGPEDIPQIGPETRRLREVYRRYEELKASWGRWDYDDFRSGALRLLEEGKPRIEAELVVVDGFRELGVLELRLLKALSRHVEVWVSLPESPPGLSPEVTLSAHPVCMLRFRAPNPVSEARWVLQAVKRDLAQNFSPLELAIVAPQPRIPTFLTLADEYGLPLVNQLPPTTADTPEGRLLLALLELPDYPTPSRLLALPELAPLGRAALERGLVGLEAIGRLAEELGMGVVWKAWLARLRSPGEEGAGSAGSPLSPLAWAEELVDALPEVRHSSSRERLMERAREAHRIAWGPHFRQWWAALLAETYEPHHPNGGVALLTPNLASGQRFRRVYITYAVEGAYGAEEVEDYFVPEELRVGLEEALRRAGGVLPRRFTGRDRLLLEELKTRAEEVVITYPEADQEGPLEPDPVLVGPAPDPLPPLPAASPLEVNPPQPYRAGLGPVLLASPTVEDLRHYEECPMRHWAERLVQDPKPEWWQLWAREVRESKKLVPARLEALAQQFPQAEGWMRHHHTLLRGLNLGFSLEDKGLRVQLDGISRRDREVHIYRFVAPGTPSKEAEEKVRKRWSERWAAAYLLSHPTWQIRRVSLWAWPVLGEPVLVYGNPIERLWEALKQHQRRVQEAKERYSSGEIKPKPGFPCRNCAVRDVCREGGPG
ncbi:MAG: ATP-dependent nuclease subunit B [Meiothermus sp.]|uniref:ATP-dependent nuclease subunit B n=1 Tax=Meiothermus sp. TaxID=1955249 RepID=UPI00298ED672|nr:ATP-dependent nuclease subunit B [Meiothermus sp.]MDW8091076.1 ATP-dependent nuclease subunit B [Meiothermus sp.]